MLPTNENMSEKELAHKHGLSQSSKGPDGYLKYIQAVANGTLDKTIVFQHYVFFTYRSLTNAVDVGLVR